MAKSNNKSLLLDPTQMFADEEPSEQELYLETLKYKWGVATRYFSSGDKDLKHEVEENGTLYKYGMPLENKPIEFEHMK